MATFCVVVGLLTLVQNGSAAKILALQLMATPSHRIPLEPLLEELASRGHQVTVVSPVTFGKNVPNMTEILTFELSTVLKIPNIFEMKECGESVQPVPMLMSYSTVCMEGLKSPAFKALKNETFDLVIIPIVFNECVGPFAMVNFKAPIIIFSPIAAIPFATSYYGNPSPPSFNPFMFTGFPQRMTFLQRLTTFLVEAFVRGMLHFKAYPALEAQSREILNDSSLPSIVEFYKNTSLMLSNSHFSISGKRPFLPDIVEVGGMHCRPAKPIPKDLENFINKGSDGFILFSMGSALKSNDISKEKVDGLLKAFSKLKQQVIWKWNGDPIPNLPANVKLGKWLPQPDLLGHPKIRLFVTHGGFASTTEAVYHGVPLVGIPLFSDQEMNMKEMGEAGIGITVDYIKLSEDTFLAAVSKVLNEPSYMANVKKLSNIFRDQIDRPLDRAVYWTEYIIRHKGALHLRSAGRDLNFFEYHSLDVVGVIVVVLLVIIALLRLLIKFIFKKVVGLFRKNPKSVSPEKKTK